MQGGPFPNLSIDILRLVTRRFAPGRLLLIGKEAMQLAEQQAFKGLASEAFPTLSALEMRQSNGSEPRFELAIWFYPPDAESVEENALISRLTTLTDQLILLPSAGANLEKRRPKLVTTFVRHGFLPNYDCEITETEPAAVHLSRSHGRSLDAFLPEVENGFARMNAQLRAAQRALRTRMTELQTADQHIARLEEKVLKLKEAKRDLKKLKAEKQALRKSPERKIGQVILAPYRLPQRLIRTMRRHFDDSAAAKERRSSPNEYEKWLQRHRASAAEQAQMRQESRAFLFRPLISIITPVYDTPAPWLKEAVQSVQQQVYENWELMLIDDGSINADTLEALSELDGTDPRIRVLRLAQSQGISAASNAGIEAAKGEWLGFLDHDDLLEPDALYQTAKWLQEHPDTDVIYSDEDKLTENGLEAPCLKPDWSPDFFLSYNYICHFTTVRRELVEKLGGFRSDYDFAQDYDLYLRLMSQTQRIHHVPRVLYHWRRSAGSTSINIRAKPEALDAARSAVEAYLVRAKEPGHVTVDWSTHAFRIRRELIEEKPIVIIIPTRDRVDLLARCLASITQKTTYGAYEIVIVDNDSHTPEARAFFEQTRHRVLRFSGPFNYSALNNFAVEKTDAPWILFLNNDTEVIDGEWLTAMAEQVQRPEVGAVGAQLQFRNKTIQHAGIVLGVRGTAKHAFCGFPAESPGVCRQLQVVRNYSAVTAACLLTRRQVFEQVGGFDEERLPVIFNDVDLCLKMRAAGYLIVYTPWAKLYHDESASRRQSVEPPEAEILRERWPSAVTRDPYYNPNLSRDQADFSLGE